MNKNIPHLNSLQLLSEVGITNWDDKDFTVIHNLLPPNLKFLQPFRTTDYIIGFVTGGSVTELINLQKFNFSKNFPIVITPFNILEVINQSDDFKISGISFTKNFITEHLANIHMLENLQFLKQGNIPVLKIADKNVIRLNMFFLIMEDIANNKNNPHRKKIIRNIIEAFLYEVDSIYQPELSLIKRKLSRKEYINIEFQDLLARYFKEQRSVGFYAGELNVTSKYLSECVKEVTGKTAGELIDQMVVLEAKVLLKNSGLNVSQVADLLHFSDIYFFSKFFKKHTDSSPSEYKKQ